MRGKGGREGGREDSFGDLFPGERKKPSNRLLLRSLLHGSRLWYPLFLFLSLTTQMFFSSSPLQSLLVI